MRRIGFIFFLLGWWAAAKAQDPVLDSLKHELRKSRQDTNRVLVLKMMAWHCQDIGQPTAAMEYANKQLKLAKKLNYKSGMVSAYNTIGSLYNDMSNLPLALETFYRALKIAKSRNNRYDIAVTYLNLGLVFDLKHDYTQAMMYYNKSLALCREMKDERLEASLRNNIGIIHQEKKEYYLAMENKSAALEIWKKLGDSLQASDGYNNLGNLNFLLGDYDMASKYYQHALDIRIALKNPKGIASSYLNLANIWRTQKKFKLARGYFQEARDIARGIGNKEVLRLSYRGLAGIDTLENKWDSAYIHLSSYFIYTDSILNEENVNNIIRQQVQYEFEQKSAEDSLKQVERTKLAKIRNQQEIHDQKMFTYTGVTGFVLMLLASIIALRANRHKQASNVFISQQKALVEQKQKEILDSIHYARRIQHAQLPTEKRIRGIMNRLRK